MNTNFQKIIKKIKGKKNQGISNEFVFKILENYLQNDFYKQLFQKDEKLILRNKHFKKLVKEIRKDLYKSYGIYQSNKINRMPKLLENLKSTSNLNGIKEISKDILKLHTSSRERLDEYDILYSEIFKLKPKIIIDLACGLNPCSLILANFKGKCFAYDIGKEIEYLNLYFNIISKHGISGEAFLQNINLDFKFKKGDMCFLFKYLDLVKDRVNFLNNLINNLDCKYLIASFSKKTISLKNMNNPERKWFVNFLRKKCLNYKILDFENEVFYIIKLK